MGRRAHWADSESLKLAGMTHSLQRGCPPIKFFSRERDEPIRLSTPRNNSLQWIQRRPSRYRTFKDLRFARFDLLASSRNSLPPTRSGRSTAVNLTVQFRFIITDIRSWDKLDTAFGPALLLPVSSHFLWMPLRRPLRQTTLHESFVLPPLSEVRTVGSNDGATQQPSEPAPAYGLVDLHPACHRPGMVGDHQPDFSKLRCRLFGDESSVTKSIDQREWNERGDLAFRFSRPAAFPTKLLWQSKRNERLFLTCDSHWVRSRVMGTSSLKPDIF
jgi:hypothetical protein